MPDSKYTVLIQAQIDPKKIVEQLKALESKVKLKIDVDIDASAAVQKLQKQISDIKNTITKGTGTGGGGMGGGINIIDTEDGNKALDALYVRIEQIRKSVGAENVKYNIFTKLGEDGETITRAVLSYTDGVSKAQTETLQLVTTIKEVEGEEEKIAEWKHIASSYTDDEIRKERLRQNELKKTNVEMKRMVDQADMALAKASGRQKVPAVQNVINIANELKAAAVGMDDAMAAGLGNEQQERVRRLSKELKIASLQMGNLGKDTLSWNEAMRVALTRIIQWGVSTAIIYGGLRQIREAVQYVKELNKELVNTQLVTNMNKEQTVALTREYNRMATELGATTLEVAKGALEWQRQGKSIEETTKLLAASTMMSKLGNMEAAESTEKLTAMVNAFNVSADDAIGLIDVLINLDNNYATSVDELTSAMQRSANSAQLVGIEFNDLASYITIVSSQTRRSADTIGEAFKTIFARMRDVNLKKKFDEDGEAINDVEKVLNRYGITLREESGAFRDFSDVLEEVGVRWDEFAKAAPTAQAEIAKAFAGVRQSETFLALMENWEKVKEAQDIAADSAGLASSRYEIYLDGMEAATNRFTAAWEKLVINTVDSDVSLFFTNLGTALLNLVDAIGFFNIVMPILLGYIGSMAIMRVSALANAFTNLAYTLGAVTTTAATTAAALAGIATAGIAIAIMGLIALIDKLDYTMKEMYQDFENSKSQFDANKTELNNLADEYERLATKTNRTREENQRLFEIQNIINTKYPDLKTGIDAYSAAIDRNTTAIEENVEALKKQAEFQAQKFIDEQKQAYEKAQKFLTTKRFDQRLGEDEYTPKVFENIGEQIKYYEQLVLEGDNLFGVNERILKSLKEQRDAAANLVIEYQNASGVLFGMADIEESVMFVDPEKANEIGDALGDAGDKADSFKDKISDIAYLMSDALGQAVENFESKQQELLYTAEELRQRIAEASSFPPSAERDAELDRLREKMYDNTLAVQENAAAYDRATKEIIFNLILQRIEIMANTGVLTEETSAAAFDMVMNLGQAWGLFGDLSQEAIGRVSSALGYLANNDAPAAAAALQEVGNWAASIAGDYYIRLNIITNTVGQPGGIDIGDVGSGVVPNQGPPLPKVPTGGYYPGGFKSGGGGGSGGGGKAKKTVKEEQYSAADLLNKIISLIRHQKQEEIDLLEIKQRGYEDEIDQLEKLQDEREDALEKQKDAYKEIIDARKELLETEQQEIEYQEKISDKNKSIADLQNELAVLSLDNSLEAKARKLEIQDDLNEELSDLEKMQRDHSYDEQKKALDDEYDLYAETIDNEIELLRAATKEQIAILEEQIQLVQDQIDIIEEYLSKAGLVAQDAMQMIIDKSPELYQALIEWNKEYGTGIDRDITDAWEEAYKALEKYKDLVDAIRGESSGGTTGSGKGGEKLNWKRQYGLIEGTPLWEEAVKLGKTEFLKRHPEIKKVKSYHSGIQSGPVGGIQTPVNEVFAKLMSGEVVMNEADMLGAIRRLPLMANLINDAKSDAGNFIIENLINVEGNLDKAVLPDIERVSKEVIRQINATLTKRGYTRNAQLFSI